ncbi:fimbrial assembly protein [Marinobacter sp. EVN1]|uniref:PilN domain-containing protein n=1 Tax=Marinobacter sp. EVN1 TaxID=1397532 RepID=UPI0003B926E4|nr:PilN domain-containing protein [Marinobacter sp. EVN1]ERS88638.1 fimbrial assembly protein [Marinobacter sp. EVN1]
MQQQVNLYTAELRPNKQKLNATSALMALALVIVVVAGLAGLVRYQNQQLEAQALAVERQNNQLEQVVARLQDEVLARQPDPDLEAALARVTETISRRQRLLGRIETLAISGHSGFSGRLSALARQVPDNLWLTGIRLESFPATLTLKGQTRSADLVPRYLERLGEEPAFIGETFSDFRISRPDGEAARQWVNFQIATENNGDTGL